MMEPLAAQAPSSYVQNDGNANITPRQKTDIAVAKQQRIFKYADTTSRILYSIALLGAVASGAAMPMMTLLFGQSISSFSNFGGSNSSSGGGLTADAAEEFRSDVDRLVRYFVYLFVARFVVGYVATLCVCVAAAKTTNALRKAFLEGLLRREVADLDVADGGSAVTQVTTSEFDLCSAVLSLECWKTMTVTLLCPLSLRLVARICYYM